MKDYFYLDESPIHKGLFCLRLNDEAEWNITGNGNFNILPARILGVGYDRYLVYCRDFLGAKLFGKDCNIPYALFKNNNATQDFVKYLNERTAMTLESRKDV